MRLSGLKSLAIAAAVTGAIAALGSIASVCAAEFKVLHALGDKPMTLKKGVVPWEGFCSIGSRNGTVGSLAKRGQQARSFGTIRKCGDVRQCVARRNDGRSG
jgi:hypothetical protein